MIFTNNKILFLNLDFGNKASVKDTMGGLGEIYANPEFKMPITDFIISATIFYNKGLDVTVIDNELDKIDHNKLIDVVNKYDKVFLRTSLPTLKNDLAFVDKVKTDICLFAPFLDKVSMEGYQFISGESEFKFLNMVNKTDYDNNMNLLPSPKWDLVDYKKYSFITCLTSKGCPYNCGYCPYPVYQGTRWRSKSVDLVIKELKKDYFDYGIDYLRFRDPELTIDKNRIIELCDKMIENGIKIKWHGETRLDLLDKELLNKMKEAGCVEISFGVETVNDETRRIINRKKIEDEKVNEILDYCKELGIKTFGFFIIGLPGENKKTTLDLIDYSLKINSHLNEFTIATPYPGTALRDWAQERNLIIKDFDDYTGRKPAMTNGIMTVRQLKTLCKYANLMHQRKLRKEYSINLKRWIYYRFKDLEYYYLKLKVKII